MRVAQTAPPPAAKRKGPKGPTLRQRLDVAARAVAAIVVGYVFAALSTAVLARLLPGGAEEATIAATLLSFAVYAAVVVWAFADPKTWRVWRGLAAGCAGLAAVLWLSLIVEPRI
jgi:hypothetical protein